MIESVHCVSAFSSRATRARMYFIRLCWIRNAVLCRDNTLMLLISDSSQIAYCISGELWRISPRAGSTQNWEGHSLHPQAYQSTMTDHANACACATRKYTHIVEILYKGFGQEAWHRRTWLLPLLSIATCGIQCQWNLFGLLSLSVEMNRGLILQCIKMRVFRIILRSPVVMVRR